MSETKINLLGLDQKALSHLMLTLGEKPFRAQQLLKWIHAEGIADFSEMTNLSKALRQRLAENCVIQSSEVFSEHQASDGTRKWLFNVAGGGAIETVYIPEPSRATLCISSQVGCALNCKFCHTAQQGFQRNLTSAEIVGQLWHVVKQLKAEGLCKAIDRPITNVVFMGMGEPLLNFDNVVSAIHIMLDDLAYGLSKRRVTVSTSGVVPAILQLRDECDVALAVSLHAPNDDLRTQIVPLNKKYPIKTLLEACNQYLREDKRRRITMEYVMLAGVNDQPQHAHQLVKCLKKVPSKVNLIPFNPFIGTQYQRSDMKTIQQFQEILMQGGLIATIRKTRGDDIDAACGQLAGEVNDKTQRSRKLKQMLSQTIPITVISSIVAACAPAPYKEENERQMMNLSEMPASIDYEKAARLHIELGLNYLKQNERPRAKSKLARAKKLAPELPEVHYAYGIFQEQVGELAEAEKSYLKAIKLNPKEGNAHHHYATFLCRQHRYEEAEKAFLQAVEAPSDINRAEAWENAGLCALQIPNQAKAIQYFEKALRYDPNRPQALEQLAKIAGSTF